MARVIYGLLALALASLVGGFFVRTSTIPLYISIGLSAVVCVLILIGISRRLRTEDFLDQPAAAGDLEEIDVGGAEETFVQPRRRKAARGSEPPARETIALERPAGPERVSEAEEDAEEEDGEEMFAPSRPATSRPSTRPRPRPRPERPEVAAHKPKARPKAKSGASRRVKVIPGRSRYHTASCRFAQGEDVRDVAESTARKRGYAPCSLCMPG